MSLFFRTRRNEASTGPTQHGPRQRRFGGRRNVGKVEGGGGHSQPEGFAKSGGSRWDEVGRPQLRRPQHRLDASSQGCRTSQKTFFCKQHFDKVLKFCYNF